MKQGDGNNIRWASLVAPPVGAWIETVVLAVLKQDVQVAPPVGAWIETGRRRRDRLVLRRRPPRGGVD